MRQRRSSSLLSALSVAMAVAIFGCGGSPTTPSTSDTAATASSASAAASSATAPSSAAATASPAESATATSPASAPSLPASSSTHADQALEDQLPTEISGTALQRSSQSISEVLDAGGDRATVDAFLQAIGKTEADGSIAAAYDPTNTLTGGILAYKVRGADTAALLAGIVSVEQADLGDGATKKAGSVGGKSVTVVSVGTGVNDIEWLYGHGDVVFVVHAPDEAHAAAFLAALP